MQICFAHGPICRHWSCPSIAHLTSHPLTLQPAIIHRGILAATPAKLLHQQAQIYETRLSVFFLPRQLRSSVNSKAAVVGGSNCSKGFHSWWPQRGVSQQHMARCPDATAFDGEDFNCRVQAIARVTLPFGWRPIGSL